MIVAMILIIRKAWGLVSDYGSDGDNSNGEMKGTWMTANAASTGPSTSSLRHKRPQTGPKNKREMPRKSELPPGAMARMMANKKIAFKKNGKTFFHADAHEVSAALTQLKIKDGGDVEVTMKAAMAKMDYSRFNEMVLVPNTSANFDNIIYNTKLSNLIGCTKYALCDGGANGCIRGQNDMRCMTLLRSEEVSCILRSVMHGGCMTLLIEYA